MLFSFNFQTLLLIVCSFFTTFFNFLLSISVTTSRCCNSQGMAFTSFRYFLLFLLTNTKSIAVSLPPILYVTFLCSFFSNHLIATRNSFSSRNMCSLLSSTFFANSIPTMHTVKNLSSCYRQIEVSLY